MHTDWYDDYYDLSTRHTRLRSLFLFFFLKKGTHLFTQALSRKLTFPQITQIFVASSWLVMCVLLACLDTRANQCKPAHPRKATNKGRTLACLIITLKGN